jgi:hypothetical protein
MPKDAQGSTTTGVCLYPKVTAHGVPFIQGCLMAPLPTGLTFIGNGTCPHPLGVQLTGAYAIVPQLLASARQFHSLYEKHLAGDEEFTDFNEQELAADMAALEKLLASVPKLERSPAEQFLDELISADLLTCTCDDECDGTCHRGQAQKILSH